MESHKTIKKTPESIYHPSEKRMIRLAVNRIKTTFAQHLKRVFQPNDIISELDSIQCQPLHSMREIIKYFTPLEVAYEIDTNINVKKAPGYDEISPRNLKELPKKTIVHLTHIY